MERHTGDGQLAVRGPGRQHPGQGVHRHLRDGKGRQDDARHELWLLSLRMKILSILSGEKTVVNHSSERFTKSDNETL